MDQSQLLMLVLAALLHDIGKLAQRAGMPRSESLEQELCPHDRYGKPSHLHVLHTDWFVEKCLPLPPELEGARSRLARMAAAHHRPSADSREELCIAAGHRLSIGNDHSEGASEGTFRTARMESVFSQIHPKGRHVQENPPRYPLKPLDDEDTPIFPGTPDAPGVEDDAKKAYGELHAALLKALKAIPTDMGVDHYMQSLQSVLERFTWCVPSSTYKTRADVSLFDHSTTTAAIAQALYRGPLTLRELDSGTEKSPLLLFGGELSGIQDFIFGQGEQADRGAGKLLRARSFSLQMLTRSVWRTLLERCRLSPVARIIDAGGRFILLLPDTPDVRQAVAHVTQEAMRHVLKEYNGILRIAFAMQELCAADLDMRSFTDVFQSLNDRLEREKLRPLAAMTGQSFSPIMGLNSTDYAPFGVCPFCGLRPARGESGDEAACKVCHDLIHQIGRRLPGAKYAVISRGEGFPPCSAACVSGCWKRFQRARPTP